MLSCLLLIFASAASAQSNGPRIAFIYPAGLQQGAMCDVMVGGATLDGVNGVQISGAGVKAEVIALIRSINQREQIEALETELKNLQTRREGAAKMADKTLDPRLVAFVKPLSPEEERRLTEIPLQLAFGSKRPSSPALAQTAFVRLSVSADAAPGAREIRLQTNAGLSNPMFFHVGRLPEMLERENRPTTDPANTTFTVPCVVNGQIMPGEVDRYRFQAKKGQHLVIVVEARDLIPYIADAVPGWFQATLAVYDKTGRELAYVDDFRFNPDPVIHLAVPVDGEYTVEIKDSIYRGREDFVYRLTVSEKPFVTGIFPLGCKAGSRAQVTLAGWNLAKDNTSVDATTLTPGIHLLPLGGPDAVQGGVPFAVDTLDECPDKEPNNTAAQPQALTLPMIVNGRIDAPGDRDIFRIEGKGGQRIVAEVLARRLNSPLDSMLRLFDAAGRQIDINDDMEDRGAGLATHHADSYLFVTLPADGAYYLQLTDTQNKGGSEFAYRLRISNLRPDFELRVTPASVSVPAGGFVPLTVHALRRDGFNENIMLALKDAPAGWSIQGGTLPAGQDKVRITLSAPPPAKNARDAPIAPPSLHLEGRAMIDGREEARQAVPAEDMMQAFIYRHLVAVSQMRCVIAGRAWANPRLPEAGPLRIPAGGTATLFVRMNTANAVEVEAQLNEPPDGITIKSSALAKGGIEIVFQADAAKIKPGVRGNLIAAALYATQSPTGVSPRRNQFGTLPAIPFEIVLP